ncbi:MAG: hypothetical protein KKH83_05775 [Candidatus Margulisbacteria bacterium]|nr:hypothetical protein [Candidatus Margulisiibacteriota bacterium]
MKVSFKKVVSAFNAQKDELAHSIVSLRRQTVKAAQGKFALHPLMQSQQRLVLSHLQKAAESLIDIHLIGRRDVIVYEAGAYSKGTCAIGSDLDLNVAFDDSRFGELYAFEKNLYKVSGYLLSIVNGVIHNNDLNLASQRPGLKKVLPAELAKHRKMTREFALWKTKGL